MRLHRADPLLNDAIEVLDLRLVEAKRRFPKASLEEHVACAWTLLTTIESDFVKEEIAKCIDSRTYYLQNFHVIQPEQGILTCLHPLYDHQIMVEETIVELFERDGQARIIILKPRQSGLTEYCNGVICWRTFLVPHAYTISVAQDPDVAAHIQRKINIAYQHLPWWMRPERQYHTKGEFIELGRKDFAVGTMDPGLGSVLVTTHAQRTTGVAIGKTVRTLHASEVSRWSNSEVYTSDIEPSMNALDTLAFMESTGYGEGNFFHNLWQEAVEGDSDWTPVFLAAYRAKKYSLPLKPNQLPFTLTDAEKATNERVLREEGVSITNEFWNWRRRRIQAAIKRTGFPYAHLECYPIVAQEAFQSSGQGAFPRHKLDEQQQANIQKPEWIGEIVYQGKNAPPKILLNHMIDREGRYLDVQLEKRQLTNRLYLWEQPNPRESYYLAVDVGGGVVGDDLSVVEVMRAGYGPYPDVQVGEWVGYEPPVAFAKIVYALGWWFNKAEIAVEYAKEGYLTANSLMNDLEYPNLYIPRREDRIGNQMARFMHWQTTSRTKPLIMGVMTETLLEDGVVIRSQYALDELRRCVRTSNSFAALSGNDDAAVTMCIALYCLRQTMPELRQGAGDGSLASTDTSNRLPTRDARVTGGTKVYGLYDQFFRLMHQERNLLTAQEMVAQRPGWQIKEIPVTKANTSYSPIYHGGGMEREMLREGVSQFEITPGVLTRYAELTHRLTQHGVMPQYRLPGQSATSPQAQRSALPPGGGGEAWWEGEMSGGIGGGMDGEMG